MILICTPFNRLSGRESEVMASIDEKRDANNELPELMNGYLQKFRLYETQSKVIQTEKETDAGFLKNLLSGPNDGTSWIDVQIISKYLDAKLTVSHCQLSKLTRALSAQGAHKQWKTTEMASQLYLVQDCVTMWSLRL